MKALLKEEFIKGYDFKKIVKLVINLFDYYNYEKITLNGYIYSPLINNFDEKSGMNKYNNNDITAKTFETHEKMFKKIEEFEKKVEMVKTTLTDDEIIIFNYSILERESDKIILDRICKTPRTYYKIKKSCYIKVALYFNLINGFKKLQLEQLVY